MAERRRRHLFPGVPAPGGPDADATAAYPGLAAELRAEPAEARQTIRDYEPEGFEAPEPERRDPALAEPLRFEQVPTRTGETIALAPVVTELDEQPVAEGETVRLDLGDGEARHRVEQVEATGPGSARITLTPLDEHGQQVGPPQTWTGVDVHGIDSGALLGVSADLWGGDRPGVGHLGLADRSADLPLADVDEWRSQAEPATAPELSAAIEATYDLPGSFEAGSDGTAPEGDEAEQVERMREAVGAGPGVAPFDVDEPEYQAETTEDGEGIAITMPCGCSFVLRPCR